MGLQGSKRHGVGGWPSEQALTHFEGCLQLQGLLGAVVCWRGQRRLRPPLVEAGQRLNGVLAEYGQSSAGGLVQMALQAGFRLQ